MAFLGLNNSYNFLPNPVSSWFEIFDYEGDGDLDIGIVQGDNADLSHFSKDYHGFRIFLNNGDFTFHETYFFPMYGATRVIAHDFDLDGDIDFALTAFFPDFMHYPEGSFYYLENRDSEKFQFIPFYFSQVLDGRWLTMEMGDMDRDGDQDIVLGSFTYSPTPATLKLTERWNHTSTDFIWLENKSTLIKTY